MPTRKGKSASPSKKKEKEVATVNKNFLKDVDERIKTLIEKNRDQAQKF